MTTAATTEKRVREAPLALRSATSLDVKARTVRARISTPLAVRSYDWERGINLDELLDPDGCVAPKGERVPLMDAHDRSSVEDILGTVANIKAEDDEEFGRAVYADLRLADTDAGNLALKLIEQDHLTDVSVGYFHEVSEFVEDGAEIEFLGRAVRGPANIVRKWSLIETSLVPVGADAAAKLRAAESQRKIMEPNSTPNGAGGNAAPTPPTAPASAAASEKKRRAKVVEVEAVVKKAVSRERLRIDRIRSAQETFARNPLVAGNEALAEQLRGYAAKAQADGTVSKRAKQEMLNIIEKGQRGANASPSNIAIGEEPGDSFHARAVDAILLRAGVFRDPSKAHKGAAELANMRLLSLAKHALSLSGDRGGANLDGDQLLQHIAQKQSGARYWRQGATVRSGFNHSTSDFPLILADAAGKALQMAYELTPASYEAWTRKVAIPDFKDRKVRQLSQAPVPQIISEGGEFAEIALTEKGEAYALDTYGSIVSIGRNTLINDDLDALSRIPRMLGDASRRFVNRLVYRVMMANPTMSEDATALYDAGHNNLSIGGAAAISVTSLGKMRGAMRTQKALNSDATDPAYMAASMRYLIVPPTQWVLASQVVNSQVDPAKNNAAFNPFSNSLVIVEEPELENTANTGYSTTAWYGAADPNSIDTVEVGFLNGVDAPVVSQEEGFTSLGMKLRSYIDVAAAVIEWRSLQKNAGA